MNLKDWNPSVEVESSCGTREVSLYTRQLMNRNVFIQGMIDGEMANSLLNQLIYLTSTSDQPINILINSEGGEVASGLIIYDLLQEIKVPVNLYCTGMAASMAAILFASGEKGHRFILPHARTMIHEPLLAGGLSGSATSIRTISNSILETKDILNKILAKHTGKTIKEINKATSFDNVMSAEESIAFGLCDSIRSILS